MTDSNKDIDWYQRGTEALGKAQGQVEVATLLYRAAKREAAQAKVTQKWTVIVALIGVVVWVIAAWEVFG